MKYSFMTGLSVVAWENYEKPKQYVRYDKDFYRTFFIFLFYSLANLELGIG